MNKKSEELFAEYVKLWDEYRQMNELAGVILKEAHEAWEKYYEHYNKWKEDKNEK